FGALLEINKATFPYFTANSAPTVRLVEFGQSIMCIIEDFYPKALTIKWKQDDREVRGLDWKTTEKESGLYRTVSVLEADLTSSSPGTKYTCEVTHGGKPYRAYLSPKAHFSVKIRPPQAKELFINSNAVIECVISGDNRKEVDGATVSWSVGGQTQTSGMTHGGVEQTGSSFTKNSTLTIPESVWFKGDEVICSASSGKKTTSEKIRVRKGDKQPSITIYKPDKSVNDSDTVSLVCEVSGSDLGDVYIMWKINASPFTEGNGMTTMVKNNKTLIVLSSLTVTGQQYNSITFTCAVKDANMENDTHPRRITASKISTTPPSAPVVVSDCAPSSDGSLTLGCVASGFFPSSISFLWTDSSSGTLRDMVQYPAVKTQDSKFTAVSHVRIKLEEGKRKTLTCQVTHPAGKTSTSTTVRETSDPTIRLLEFGQSILCMIEDFYPKALTIKWKKDDREVRGLDWKTSESDSGSYRTVSVLQENLASSSPGTKYTCEVTHRGKTYPAHLSSKAEFSVKISPPQAKELFLNSKAAIECVISGDDRKEVEGATVTWSVGGQTQTSGVTRGGDKSTGSSFTKTSTLTIAESAWFKGDEVNCSASSGQKTTSEKIRVRKGATRPSITIYKPDKSVRDSDTVSLVCEVSSSDSADVYIMWQENGGQYMEGNGMTTMFKNDRTQIVLSTLTVTGQKYNSAEFTCAVKDANTQNDIQPRIFPPAKANSAPTVRLVEFGQSIMCIIEDFFPKALTIKWKKNDREVRGLDWKTTEKESGLYRTLSVLEGDQASSSPGTKYTCEVTHGGKTYSVHLSPKAEFSVKISPPQAKELFLNSKAAIECVISGDVKKEVDGATVSWTVGGRTQTSGIKLGGVTQTGSAFTKTSTLTITESAWFSATRPSITIYKPDKSVRDSDTVSLVCEVSSSDSADVYIMWKENGGQYMEGNGMTTMVKNDRTQIVLSTLTVTGQKYNSAEFTCAVKDANTQNDIQPRIFPPAKANSAPTVRLVEFGQSIMCIIEDFYPKALTIKWKKNDREVRGLDWKTTEKESGLYRTVSVLEGDQASSSPGTTYTCEVTHGGKPYSSHLSSKAEFSVKISPPQAKELFLNSKAVIECAISGDVKKEVEGAKVSWSVGGQTQTSGITLGGVTQTGSAFTKTSTLTIPESAWFSATRPSVTIYKPDKSVSDSDTVSLVCEVSSSDSADVYIMWKENGGQYLEGNGMTTMVKNNQTQIVLSTLTVTGQKYNSAEFACAVKDANTPNDIQPRIFPPAKANSSPTIHLVEFQQSILCMIEDFYPKALTIKWKEDDREVRGLDWKTTENDSGSYRTVSVLQANLTSSSPGTKYTCEVTHGGKTYSEHLSSKAHFYLKISPPQAKDLFINNKAVIHCVINGDNLKEVEGATVSWTVGGQSPTAHDVHTGGLEQTGSSFSKTSTLTIEESSWFSGAEVMCSTTSGQKTTSEKIKVKKGGKPPSITVYKPVNETERMSLVCEVSSSDIANVYIMWQENDDQFMEGNSTTVITKNHNTSVVLSYLTVTGKQYNSAKFACAVKDPNMENTTQPKKSTTSKRELPGPDPGFYAQCNKDILEEDEFNSLWSTTSSFIFLFIFSAIYSTVLSLIKV
ncbi:hypothetical protein NFI96_030169, partial [Prochilodus magdalenae]